MAIDREVVAHHEAGHAVIADFLRCENERVSIVSDGEAAGEVIHNYGCDIDEIKNDPAFDPKLGSYRQWILEREAIIALAGETAQHRFRRSPPAVWF